MTTTSRTRNSQDRESRKLVGTQMKYLRDYDAGAGRSFPEAHRRLNAIRARVEARAQR